ncbi:4-hydroxythreonine-4-phosphate dehydrogenase [beta proteobacterium KB13]|uniref:4-hydroxythreonine-4-phosphate dehydrogenase n=1 Tax=beta proteobacterium KB13 TaxID=314607 RepID=B6BUU4_9PROT|nr:4-hydroxythreonine-4-phosphate dehydrogenase [beta proteobacterium KB13]
MNHIKTLAVSAGDPDGIGYDLCALLFKKNLNYHVDIYGDKEALLSRAKLLGIKNLHNEKIKIYDVKNNKQIKNKRELVLESIKSATKSCIQKKSIALVTLPVNKEKLSTSKNLFTGHTEYIAELLKARNEPIMTFIGNKKIIVATNTTHMSLLNAIKNVEKNNLINKLQLLHSCIKNQLKIKYPKILVTGLNPHAGENNLFGNEESKHIIPAINKLKELDIHLDGPVPADTALLKNNMRKYDCIYYMYHDQALCAFKTLFFDTGVNLTLGLPIIRTSVDHGTAEELVGKKERISIKSFLNALDIAEKLSH